MKNDFQEPVRDRMIEAMKDFGRAHQGEKLMPSKIHIPFLEEMEIAKLTVAEIGSKAEDIIKMGVRKAWPKPFGLEAVWDAETLHVE